MVSRRTTGAVLLAVAAFLHGVRYLSAAVLGSGLAGGRSSELFGVMLQYVGPGLDRWAIAALVVGVAFLVGGEISPGRE